MADMLLTVRVAPDAIMTMTNPLADPHPVWLLTWGREFGADMRPAETAAASALESFDYLLSSAIPLNEAVRRLRLMRAARREITDRKAFPCL